MKKVVKFGGSSLASAEQFKKVGAIIKADASRVFVVPSAPGKRFSDDTKVTDMLLHVYASATEGKDISDEIKAIKARYDEIIEGLELNFSLDKDFEVIEKKLKEDPQKDYAASRGEFLNGKIMAEYLGIPFIDAAEVIFFNEEGNLNSYKTEKTLASRLAEAETAVVPGFYGMGKDGNVKTFSRGGSDVTGSIVAQASRADVYENWTDVSGLLAADPRIVDNPKSVEYMSCRELRTLSYMGASVLHTDAVLPASDAGIPINIRNTNRPDDAGTMIVKELPNDVDKAPITGVAGRNGMSVIQIEKVMVSDGAGFTALMLDMLKNRGIPFEQCLTGIDTSTLVIRSDIFNEVKDDLISEIEDVLHPDFIGIKENLSMIAVVGERGTEVSNANIKVLQALTDEGIEISTINQGAGKLNLLVGVPEECYENAIRVIYATVELI